MEILIEYDPASKMVSIMANGKVAFLDDVNKFRPSVETFSALFTNLGARVYTKKRSIQTHEEIDRELMEDSFYD